MAKQLNNFYVNEVVVIILFAILLYSLSNIININHHGMIKGVLLIFTIIICSKCSIPTGIICSLLIITYLYDINSKQKEAFNTGRVGKGLDDIAEGILHGTEDIGEGIVDGIKDVGKGISDAGHDIFGKGAKKSESADDNDENNTSDEESDDTDESDDDSDNDVYVDEDHPSDHKEKVDTSEEDKLYKQYEKCMYGDEILDKNANDYEDDIDERIDNVKEMDKTFHCGDKRHKPNENKILSKIKNMTKVLDKHTRKLQLLLRKFYKSIEDESLVHRNLVDVRDSFDNANRQVILMVDYADKLDSIDKKSNKKLLNFTNNIIDFMDSMDIIKTVKKKYKFNEDQQDIIKRMSRNGLEILTTLNTIKKLL